MQNIVIAEPYQFIPPRVGRFWLAIGRMLARRQLPNEFGVCAVECRGVERLRASLDAGCGVVLASNHCRPCDPLVIDSLSQEVARPFHIIASWHLFMGSAMKRFLLPRVGAFSVYREGTDRESLKCAVKTVADGRFPLVVFAEGIVSRGNDRLLPFMDGPSFIARAAAKQRADGKVMIHPVFIRYFFEGDLAATVEPVLAAIEKRLSWAARTDMDLLDRVHSTGAALLALKEMEYLGAPRVGTTAERRAFLMEALLAPLESEWCSGRGDGDPMARVKRLRTAILPDMAAGKCDAAEGGRRWRQLAALYLVQQLWCYPDNYLDDPTPERILETVERLEEDLTDVASPHRPLRAVVTVDGPVVADGSRDRSRGDDPVTAELRHRMERLLKETRGLGTEAAQ